MSNRTVLSLLLSCGLLALGCDDETSTTPTTTLTTSSTSSGGGGAGLSGGSGTTGGSSQGGGTGGDATGGATSGGGTGGGATGGAGGSGGSGGSQSGCDALWDVEVACAGGTSVTAATVQGGSLLLSALGLAPGCSGGPGPVSSGRYDLLVHQAGIAGDFSVTASFVAFAPSGATAAPASAGAYITATGFDIVHTGVFDDGTNRGVRIGTSGAAQQTLGSLTDTAGSFILARAGATATLTATLGSTTITNTFTAPVGAVEFGLGVDPSSDATAAAVATTIQFTNVTFTAGGHSDTFSCDSLVP